LALRRLSTWALAGIGRPLLLLGLVSFFTDISSEMIYPLVPLFLTGPLGAPATVVGLIEGLAESAASILKVPSGWLSDRLGRRRPLVFLGYSLSALGKPLLALSFVWPLALIARFVDRSGKGVRTPPRDALIADLAEEGLRGRAFGLHRAMDTAGAIVGPLFAFALLGPLGGSLRLIFLIAFLPAAAGALLVRAVEEGRPLLRPAGRRPSQRLSSFGWEFKAFLMVSLIFALGNSSDAFLLLRAQRLGLGTGQVVLAYVLYNGFYALLSLPAGALSDRLGRRRVISLGFLLFALVYFGFAAGAGPLIWALFGVYGAYMALTEGVGRALASDLSPPEGRGMALGLYHTGIGAMALVASLLAGLLWDALGSGAPFLLGGATASLAAFLLMALWRRS